MFTYKFLNFNLSGFLLTSSQLINTLNFIDTIKCCIHISITDYFFTTKENLKLSEEKISLNHSFAAIFFFTHNAFKRILID